MWKTVLDMTAVMELIRTKNQRRSGWYPETPFEKGIVLTIDWYLNNEEWMDHVTSGDYQKYYEQMYKNKAEVEG